MPENRDARQLLIMDEGEGLTGHLYRCKMCHKGWSIGGTFSRGPNHAAGCIVPQIDAALTALTRERDTLQAERDHFQAHYEAALFNWNEVLRERDTLHQQVAELIGKLQEWEGWRGMIESHGLTAPEAPAVPQSETP